jgi:hypothetical protein
MSSLRHYAGLAKQAIALSVRSSLESQLQAQPLYNITCLLLEDTSLKPLLDGHDAYLEFVGTVGQLENWLKLVNFSRY